MAAAAPWSVKGIDPEARAVAKDLARREGLTLGAWLNKRILEDAQAHAAEDEGGGDALRDAVEQLTGRVEAVEQRSRDAYDALTRSVAALEDGGEAGSLARLTRRLDHTESYAAALGERLSAQDQRNAQALRAMNDLSGALADRVGRIEAASGVDPEADAHRFKALRRELLDVVATTRNELAGAIESAAQGSSAAGGARVEMLERSLAEAIARIDRTEQRQKDAFRRIGEQLDRLAHVAARPSAGAQAGAVESLRAEIDAVGKRADGAARKLGADMAELGRALGKRVAEGESRAAAALEAAGERVVEAMERLDSQRDEQVRAFAEDTRKSLEQRLAESERRSAERLDQAIDAVRHKLEIARSEAQDALSPVQRAMNALALRLEAIESARASREAEPARALPDDPVGGPFAGPAADQADAGPSGDPDAFGDILALDEPEPETAMDRNDAEPASDDDKDAHPDDALRFAGEEVDPGAPETGGEDPGDGAEHAALRDPDADGDVHDRTAPPAAETLYGPQRVAGAEEDEDAEEVDLQTLLRFAPAGVGPDLEAPQRFDPRDAGEPPRRGRLMLIGSSLVGFLLVGAAGVMLMLDRGGPTSAVAEAPVAVETAAAGAARMADNGAAARATAAAMYENGVRLVRAGEPERALPLLRTAAEAGIADAQYRYSKLLEAGEAGAPDPEAALRWTLAAAEQGHLRAMHNAGVMHATGAAGEQDFNAAARWFSLAARGGFRDAQFNLALLHEQGLGVPRDRTLAYEWLLIAAAAGDGDARERANAMRRDLDPDQRRTAETRAQAFRPEPPDSSGQGRFAEEAAVQPGFAPGTVAALARPGG